MGVLPPFPNFLPFLSFYSTLRQYRVTLSCWESGLPSSPISLFHFQSKSGTLPFPLKPPRSVPVPVGGHIGDGHIRGLTHTASYVPASEGDYVTGRYRWRTQIGD